MKRDYYIDYLRGIATFAVILWHSMSPVYYLFGPMQEWGPANILFGCVIRWSVVSFIMISGALLLGKEEAPAVFYKKRFLRICIPVVTWTLIYGLMRLYYFKVYSYSGLPKPSFFKYIVLGQYGDLLFDRLSYHLYFISLILGLYAITPFLGKMVRALNQKELGALVAIGIGIYSLKTFFPSLLIVDHWQLGGYFFYFLLGYYLHKYPLKKFLRRVIYAVGIVAAVLMTWLNYRVEYVLKGHGDGYYNSEGFFVYAITIALFVLFRQMSSDKPGKGIVRKGLLFISSNSYGMYIAHPLVISFLLYGDLGTFTFSTAVSKFEDLFGYKVTMTTNQAWGAVVQAMLVTGALMLFFYLIKKLRLQRYFT